MLGFKRWRATELLWSWCAYWVVLAAVTLGPGILAAWRVTRPGGGHGSVTAGFGNGTMQMSVTNSSQAVAEVWSASMSLSTVLLWAAVPPLVLWVFWLVSRPKRELRTVPAPGLVSAPPAEGYADVTRSREANHVEERERPS